MNLLMVPDMTDLTLRTNDSGARAWSVDSSISLKDEETWCLLSMRSFWLPLRKKSWILVYRAFRGLVVIARLLDMICRYLLKWWLSEGLMYRQRTAVIRLLVVLFNMVLVRMVAIYMVTSVNRAKSCSSRILRKNGMWSGSWSIAIC